MAETVMPSVRGRQRVWVHLALTAGAVASAALAGFAIGIGGQGLVTVLSRLGVFRFNQFASWPDDRGSVVLMIVGAALALDIANLSTGAGTTTGATGVYRKAGTKVLAPVTLGRQVPQEWGRLLPLPVTAGLYGARLGVGPLTILSTWMWWGAVLAASLLGVWTTVAVSVVFALARMVVNAMIAPMVEAGGITSKAELLIRVKRSGWGALTLSGIGMLAIFALAGCSVTESAARPALVDTPMSTEVTIGSAVDDGSTPWPTAPAQLEDFVRTSSTRSHRAEQAADRDEADTPSEIAGDSAKEDRDSRAASTVEPADAVLVHQHHLARLLPDKLAGMEAVDDPSVDRFLDIDAAAAIQPDPTEEIALLETRGFRGGWIRAFRSPTADVAVVAVYEFRDEAEAEFYLEDGLITIGGYGGQFFDLPQLPEVRGFQQQSEDDGDSVQTLGGAFFHENRWHLLYLVGAQTSVTPEKLIPALEAFQASAVGGRQPTLATAN